MTTIFEIISRICKRYPTYIVGGLCLSGLCFGAEIISGNFVANYFSPEAGHRNEVVATSVMLPNDQTVAAQNKVGVNAPFQSSFASTQQNDAVVCDLQAKKLSLWRRGQFTANASESHLPMLPKRSTGSQSKNDGIALHDLSSEGSSDVILQTNFSNDTDSEIITNQNVTTTAATTNVSNNLQATVLPWQTDLVLQPQQSQTTLEYNTKQAPPSQNMTYSPTFGSYAETDASRRDTGAPYENQPYRNSLNLPQQENTAASQSVLIAYHEPTVQPSTQTNYTLSQSPHRRYPASATMPARNVGQGKTLSYWQPAYDDQLLLETADKDFVLPETEPTQSEPKKSLTSIDVSYTPVVLQSPAGDRNEISTDTGDTYVTREELSEIINEQMANSRWSNTGTAGANTAWKKGVFTITPYGYINVSTSYETERTVNGDFALYSLSPDLDNGGHSGFHIDPKSSRIGVKIGGPNIQFWDRCYKTSALFEVDFQNTNYSGTRNRGALMLRRAFVDFTNDETRILIGQEWEVISPLVPQSLNYVPGSCTGNLAYRRAQIRWEKNRKWNCDQNLLFQFAICDNVPYDYVADGSVNKANSGWPMLQGRVAISFDHSHVNLDPMTFGIAAHLGELTYNYTNLPGVNANTKYRHETWSVGLDADIPITKRWRLSGEMYTGTNLSSSLAGIGQGVDLFRTMSGNCDPHSLDAHGGWFNVNYKATKKFQMNAGYCFEKVDDAIGTARLPNGDFSARDQNQMFFLNGIYNWTDNFMTGFEVSQWHTEWHTYNTVSQQITEVEPGETTRLDLLVRYTF